MLTDLKYAARQLAKNPGFTVFAALTLALGIGANTAIFTVINSVFLSTLPVKDPQRLVFLTDPNDHGFLFGGNPGVRTLLTYPEFQELRAHNTVFSGVLAVNSNPQEVPVDSADQPGASHLENISMVSGDYFSVLGVTAILGRTFAAEVDRVRDATPVAVLSYEFWQDRFGGDPGILGRKLRIQKTTFDIIGVMPPGFSGETVGLAPAAWVPMTMQAEIVPGSDWLSPEQNPYGKKLWLQVIGRLKRGLSLPQANASIEATFQQYLQDQSTELAKDRRKGFLNQHIVLTGGGRGGSTLRKGYGEPLLILMALVALLLLIACANVANLLLARATVREKEIAIRFAVGAKPGQVFRQLMTESLLLSGLGAVGSLVFSRGGALLLLRWAGSNVEVHPNGRILLFTCGVSVLVALLFGTGPALRAAQLDLNTLLKGTAGGPLSPSGRASLRDGFVVAQVALSLLLLIVAGLFVRSFQKLTVVDLGYDHDHLLLFGINPTSSGYKRPAVEQLYQKLGDRIRAIPGVRNVTFSSAGPFSGINMDDRISIEAYAQASGQEMWAKFDQIGPGFFSTLGIPLLLGREIGPSDESGGQRVGLINQTMARYYFGTANPLGRRIRDINPLLHDADFVVVGVVADAKYHGAREADLRRFYVPFAHPLYGQSGANFAVRVTGDPDAAIASVWAAAKEIAPNLPVIEPHPMNEVIDRTLGVDRLLTELSGCFGGLAALLASIGIYGVVSYAVARRTREVGIRMALGAQRGSVLRLILGESLRWVLMGVAIGGMAAIEAAKLISGLLFGLPLVDPPVLAAAAFLMVVVGGVAGYLPARRATLVDPTVALRAE